LILDQESPYLVSFEITKDCNYRCAFCYQSERIRSKEKDVPAIDVVRGVTPPRQQPEMTVDQIRDCLIPQIAEMGVKSFCFIGAEPLMRFDDIIALAPHFKQCKELKDVQITTNGYLLTEEKIDKIREAYGRWMITFAIPLDSPDQSIVSVLRPPKKDVVERSIAAIKLVVKKGFYMSSGMVVNQLNFHQIDAVGDIIKKIGKKSVFREMYPMFNVGNAKMNSSLCLDENQIKFVDSYKIKNYGNDMLMWDSMPFPVNDVTWNKVKKHAFETDISRGCSAGNNYFNIDHAGNVYPCNFLEIYLGNVVDDPHALKNIWDTHPLVQQLRNREVGGKCGTCKYKINCGGCRSRAFVETGDVLGGVESCDGCPTGHPMESVLEKNVVHAYRKYRPALAMYRAYTVLKSLVKRTK